MFLKDFFTKNYNWLILEYQDIKITCSLYKNMSPRDLELWIRTKADVKFRLTSDEFPSFGETVNIAP